MELENPLNKIRAFVFCCLVFFAFWAFRMFLFAVWAGAMPLPKQQKRKHALTRTAKNTRPPLEQQQKKSPLLIAPLQNLIFGKKLRALHVRGRVVFFCCLGVLACFIFCFLAGGGEGRVLLFAVWAGCVFPFSCLGRGVFLFLLFGRGREFTHLPACLPGLQGA